MLKKLRIQFVAIVMASVALVLVVVFSGICITEHQRSMSEVQEALASSLDRAAEDALRVENQSIGGFPSSASASSSGPYSGSSSSAWRGGSGLSVDPSAEAAGDGAFAGKPDDFQGFNGGPRIGGKGQENRSLIPVGVYTVTASKELVVASGYTTAFIEEDTLSSVAATVSAVEDGSGELSDAGLMYLKRTVESTTYVAFADSSYASGWQSLALTLTIAGIVVLAVFFVIALLLSKWALKPVEEAWESQRQFVADASHELKTPLTVILANTSILLKHPESSIANQSQWVESTQVEAENMQGLVNEMLELAQVESRAAAVYSPIDFSDMVNGQVLQFESVAFERGCTFQDEIADGITVNGDVQQLRKMTSTLIENALKYVDEGGEVKAMLQAQGKQARLSISNTGSTISSEDLPHIFDRFYRTDKARTSGAGGFGLGLAIARETAREHGGDITCASDESGTTFTVTMPIA